MVNSYASVVSLVVALRWRRRIRWPPSEPKGGAFWTTQLTITIGGKAFGATLSDNPTAAAFKALLPLSVNMSELNGNEKLYRLPTSLPAQPSRPASIQNRPTLYGENTVVLF